jgi:hypothetical protein
VREQNVLRGEIYMGSVDIRRTTVQPYAEATRYVIVRRRSGSAPGPPETTPIGNQSTAGALSRENPGATVIEIMDVLRACT